VSSNAATGSLTVTVIPWRADAGGKRIHLIGGAGSAVNLTRELYRLGCVLSGGIAHEYDSDEKLWKNLGIPCPTIGAFGRITDDDVAAAASLVREADLTILCSFPVGPGNLGNLALAGLARNLVVMRTGPRDAPRGFVTAEGKALFEGLCSRGRLMLYEEILAELERPG
jgi:iron complex transport system ATP-binding protein